MSKANHEKSSPPKASDNIPEEGAVGLWEPEGSEKWLCLILGLLYRHDIDIKSFIPNIMKILEHEIERPLIDQLWKAVAPNRLRALHPHHYPQNFKKESGSASFSLWTWFCRHWSLLGIWNTHCLSHSFDVLLKSFLTQTLLRTRIRKATIVWEICRSGLHIFNDVILVFGTDSHVCLGLREEDALLICRSSPVGQIP